MNKWYLNFSILLLLYNLFFTQLNQTQPFIYA